MSTNLFIEIGTKKSEIGIKYEIENTARSGWHSETQVIEEVVAIWNILDFPINRKSAREELIFKYLLNHFHNFMKNLLVVEYPGGIPEVPGKPWTEFQYIMRPHGNRQRDRQTETTEKINFLQPHLAGRNKDYYL